jgi:hypothetical protein
MKPCEAQIEAAAIAIHRVFANQSGRARDFNQLPEKLKEDYRKEAAAALEAASEILPKNVVVR